MPRMRCIQEVVDYFKEKDPKTQISRHFILNAIDAGFPVIKTGSKTLINLDLFIKYLDGNYVPGEKNTKNFSVTEK